MSDDRADIEIGAKTTRLAAGLRAARSMVSGFASTAARGIGSAFSAVNSKLKLGDTGKAAAGHLLGGIGERGLDSLIDGATAVRDFERNLKRYEITTSGSAASTAAMRSQIAALSKETGIAREEILAGASTYVALTGDAKGASDAMAAFARISQASGASVADVANATAALRTSMGLEAKDIEAVFSGLIVQGKAGAVEIKDMAGELATLAPQFANFRGGKGVEGIREMGAAFQVIRTGAGSASEAATQFQALMGSLADSETLRKLQAIKIRVYDPDGSMRSASEIFEDIAKNQKLADPRIIGAIFGRKEAQQAVRSLRNHIDLYRELKVAAQDTGAVQRDLDSYLASDAGRLDKAFNDMKVTIAEAFTPERITAFTNAVQALAEKLGPVVDFIGKAADKLGGLYDVGRKVRGFLGDNNSNNPWGNKLDEARDFQIANGTGAWIQTPDGRWVRRDSAEGRGHVTAAQLRLKHRKGYESSVENILGGEVDERTTDDSIGRAIAAKHSDNIGAQLAGDRYLKAAGVDEAKVQAIVKGAIQGTAEEFGRNMKDALTAALGGLNIELGRDKVVDATRESGKNRTR